MEFRERRMIRSGDLHVDLPIDRVTSSLRRSPSGGLEFSGTDADRLQEFGDAVALLNSAATSSEDMSPGDRASSL